MKVIVKLYFRRVINLQMMSICVSSGPILYSYITCAIPSNKQKIGQTLALWTNLRFFLPFLLSVGACIRKFIFDTTYSKWINYQTHFRIRVYSACTVLCVYQWYLRIANKKRRERAFQSFGAVDAPASLLRAYCSTNSPNTLLFHRYNDQMLIDCLSITIFEGIYRKFWLLAWRFINRINFTYIEEDHIETGTAIHVTMKRSQRAIGNWFSWFLCAQQQ